MARPTILRKIARVREALAAADELAGVAEAVVAPKRPRKKKAAKKKARRR